MEILFYIIIITIGYLLYIEFTKKQHTIYGKIAWSRKEAKKGLMFRKNPLHYNEGMLFPMKKNNINSMWMKNTYISLDMIFIDENGIVSSIEKNTEPQSLKTIRSEKPIKYVLELAKGTTDQIKLIEGDHIYW